MVALLAFFAVIYFLLPLRLFYMKKMRVEAGLVLILSCIPALWYYVTIDKGPEVGLLIIAEIFEIILALLCFTPSAKVIFPFAYMLNVAIFTALFMPQLTQLYHDTTRFFHKS